MLRSNRIVQRNIRDYIKDENHEEFSIECQQTQLVGRSY